jgi:MFS family permease
MVSEGGDVVKLMIGGAGRRGRLWTPVAGPLIRVLVCWLLVSGAGWAVVTAIAVYAFDRAGATGVALVALARLMSAAVAAPIAGVALERFGRVRVVRASCVAQTGALIAVGLLVLAGGSSAALATAMGVTGAVTAAARPGLQVLLSGLSGDEAERAWRSSWARSGLAWPSGWPACRAPRSP